MDDNNSFLSNYNKNMGPEEDLALSDSAPVYKYEEKSDFKKPENTGGGYIPPSRKMPKYLIPSIIGIVIVIIIAVVLVSVLGGGVKVADFSGWSLSDAQLWASSNGVMLKTTNEYNDKVDNGMVISQDIKPDSTIKKGAFLTLKVSQGHDLSVTLPLPDFMTMTKDQVQKWADDNFMTKVRITTEFSDTVAAGKVIRFEINDSTVVDKVRRDSPVYIIVSKGSEDASSIQVTVPDFKDMSIAESYIFANDNGLTLTVTEQYDQYVPDGTVISQSVKKDEKVNKGTEIKLVVSKGKEIKIPDFSEYKKDEATSVATALGVPFTIVERYSSRKAGAFISQSIDADTVFEKGQYLELDYSLGNKVELASYVGQTLDAIQSWANELNNKGASINVIPTSITSSYPKGTIIYQNVSNDKISYKSTIKVKVSLGIKVPKFVDSTSGLNRDYDTAISLEKATEMCKNLGITPIFIKESSSGRLPNEVWFQDIPLGTYISASSNITLKYNPDATTYKVEDFTGKSTTDITNGGYKKKFTIIYGKGDYDPLYPGKVVDQSVTAGTSVDAGSIIILYFSPDSP